MRGRGDRSQAQMGGGQHAPANANAVGYEQEAASMQPIDLVAPELGSMAQFEAPARAPEQVHKAGNSGDALVFIAMGLVSTALGLGLYAHLGIEIAVALIAAFGLFVSTSFLHVFVRRMQGVDLLDRRVSALEEKVFDTANPVVEAVTPLDLETASAANDAALPNLTTQTPAPNATLPAQDGISRIDESAVLDVADLPPAYSIPRDAAGGFGQEPLTGSIADPIFDLTNAQTYPAKTVTEQADPAALPSAQARETSDAPQADTAERSIDGLVRQLSQGMTGQRDEMPAASSREQREALAPTTPTVQEQAPVAPVSEQFGQRTVPPVARREAGETPLISMPQPTEPITADPHHSDMVILGDAGTKTAPLDPVSQAIQDAATRGDVDIYLQPILSIEDRKVRFFEVMGRIAGRSGEMIAAEENVELARTLLVSAKLDRAIMIRAARLLRKLSERRQAQPLFCNISRESLAETAFAQEFVEFMGGYRDLAPYMIFEIDHAAIIDADTTSINNVRALAAMGFRISIDNVSNVEQALANGRELDVSFIKLPHDAFLPAQQNQAEARARAATIQNVARDSGMTLIIDRIERKEQLAGVVGCGVNLGQGYLFSEPKPLLPQVAAEVASDSAAA